MLRVSEAGLNAFSYLFLVSLDKNLSKNDLNEYELQICLECVLFIYLYLR